jgi:ABC-2 type transport system ATP-binding protein
VAGFDCASQAERIKPLIGVVFEHQNLYERLSGRENLAFFARLYGAPAARVEESLELAGLRDRAREPVHAYSNGMKQRLLIARAMLHRPQILFLDEPTRGLDPAAARGLRETVAALGASGATVFLTTHYMEEADRLCARVAFLHAGRIVAQGTPRELKLAHGRRRVRILLKEDGDSERVLSLDDPAEARELAGYLERGRALTVHSEEATLEEVFLRLAGRRLE